MANPVGWFEVSGPDAGGLQRFYAEAFGWEIDADNEMNYGMVAAPEGGIGGGVGPSPDGKAYATFYVAVPDVQEALDRVGKAGRHHRDAADGCPRRPHHRVLQRPRREPHRPHEGDVGLTPLAAGSGPGARAVGTHGLMTVTDRSR